MRPCFTLAILLLTISPSGTKQQQAQPQTHSQDTQSLSGPSSPVTVVVNQPTAQNKEERPAKKAHDWYDYAIVFAALVAAFIGLRSLHQVERQAKATEETATAANNNALAVINSERAWVFADIEPTIGHHGRFVNTETGETSIYARLNCRNVGRTPAWIFEVRMRFMFVRADEIPAMPPLKEAEPIWAGTHPMAPKDEPFSTGDNTLTAKGVQGIDSVTGERALVYGVVYYRDIYEKVRSTTFGYRLMPGTDTRFTRLINYPKYNEGT